MGKRKYITKRSIEEFTAPSQIPPEIEDEILEAFANYSIEQDMTMKHFPSFLKDLRIPKEFIIGNKRLKASELTLEGTDVIDFDKLLLKSYQLVLFRENKDLIKECWNILQSETKEKKTLLNIQDLKTIDQSNKVGISDVLLLDMITVATDGHSVDAGLIDLAYIMGKLGELT